MQLEHIQFLKKEEIQSLLDIILIEEDHPDVVQEARNSLTMNFTPLALSISSSYHLQGGSNDALNEETDSTAISGLIEAINNLDKSKCNSVRSFIAYIKKYIKGGVLQLLKTEIKETTPISLDALTQTQKDGILSMAAIPSEQDPFNIEVRNRLQDRFYEILNKGVRNPVARRIFILKTGLEDGEARSFKSIARELEIPEERAKTLYESVCHILRGDPVLRDLIS